MGLAERETLIMTWVLFHTYTGIVPWLVSIFGIQALYYLILTVYRIVFQTWCIEEAEASADEVKDEMKRRSVLEHELNLRYYLLKSDAKFCLAYSIIAGIILASPSYVGQRIPSPDLAFGIWGLIYHRLPPTIGAFLICVVLCYCYAKWSEKERHVYFIQNIIAQIKIRAMEESQ